MEAFLNSRSVSFINQSLQEKLQAQSTDFTSTQLTFTKKDMQTEIFPLKKRATFKSAFNRSICNIIWKHTLRLQQSETEPQVLEFLPNKGYNLIEIGLIFDEDV